MSERPHDALIRLLAPQLDSISRRQAFAISAFGPDAPLIARLNPDLPAYDFILHMCRVLAPDTAQLDAVVDEAQRQLGPNLVAELNALRPALHLWLMGGAVAEDQQRISVFLSYARADDGSDYDDPNKSFMRWLYNGLRDAGFNPWWDRENLPSRGEAFTAEIEAAILSCERLVLVVGPGAVASEHVRKEWECALSQCLPITPILRAGEYDLVPEAPREVNALDFRPTRDRTASLADLIGRLREASLPLGQLCNVQPLPKGFITREVPFKAARDAIRADAINPVVVSAPPRATALYGYGGIGKSTLAAALAADCAVRRRFKDGVIWLDIGQQPIVASRQADLGALFGDEREHYRDEQSGQLRLSWLLAEKQALIVLDDVWDHQVVARFPHGRQCRLLLTTRSPQIAQLVEGADVRLDLLTPEEGARLMAARAGGDANGPTYRRISQELGGLTLAISLAAAQIAEGYAASAATFLSLLEKRSGSEDPFRDLVVKDEDTSLDFEKSLSLSYGALSSDLKRRFRALGILAPESQLDLGLAAAFWDDADGDDARKPLTALVRAGLIESAAEGRYSLHRLLRAYARALLIREHELESVFGRYAEHITALASQFDDNPPEAWGAFEPFLAPHLLEVGDGLKARFADIGQDDETLTDRALQYANKIMRYLSNRREVQRPGWLEMGRAAASRQKDRRREASFLSAIGEAWSTVGEKRRALEHFEQAHQFFCALGEYSSVAATLNNIGTVLDDLGDRPKALETYKQALSMHRQIGDRRGEAVTLSNMGLVWSARGEKHKALEHYKKALSIQRATGNRNDEATTLTNIGVAYDDLGDKRRALAYYDAALPLLRDLGDLLGQAVTLSNIGMAWNALGELSRALEYFEQALSLHRKIGDPTGEATTLNSIGTASFALGDWREAMDHYDEARSLYRAVNDRGGEATSLSNMAVLWIEQGDPDKALEYYKQALNLFRAVGERHGEASLLMNMAVLFRHLGASEEAVSHAESGLAILTLLNTPYDAAGVPKSEYERFIEDIKRERDE